MAFTYTDVKNDALIDLKGTSKAAYKDSIMNKIVLDAVQIARRAVSDKNPELIWTTKQIDLLPGTGYGPYAISSDYESPCMLLDEYDKKVDPGFRGQYDVSERTCKPDGWWTEGYNPANLYVNATPDQARSWTLYYIATLARSANMDTPVPLPDFFRESLCKWTVKMAAESEEYTTMEEDEKINIMEGFIAKILRKRRSMFKFSVSGVGF